MVRWIGSLIAGLWRFSRRSWIDVGQGLRPRSGASALYLFLFLIFFLIGLVLVLLGVDLDEADRFLEAQGGWLDAVGSWLFRIVAGLLLLLCAGIIAMQIFVRREEKPGLGCALVAIVAGYFAWFGMVSEL